MPSMINVIIIPGHLDAIYCAIIELTGYPTSITILCSMHLSTGSFDFLIRLWSFTVARDTGSVYLKIPKMSWHRG